MKLRVICPVCGQPANRTYNILSETVISIRTEDFQLFFIITVSYFIKPKCLKVLQNNRRHLTELFRSLLMGAIYIEAVCRPISVITMETWAVT